MKIQKNIPILPRGKYHRIALQMEDGDSVLCTAKEAGALRMAIVKYCPEYKAKWQSEKKRKYEHIRYRVWKVKK
jgi:hypothetical protein